MERSGTVRQFRLVGVWQCAVWSVWIGLAVGVSCGDAGFVEERWVVAGKMKGEILWYTNGNQEAG